MSNGTYYNLTKARTSSCECGIYLLIDIQSSHSVVKNAIKIENELYCYFKNKKHKLNAFRVIIYLVAIDICGIFFWMKIVCDHSCSFPNFPNFTGLSIGVLASGFHVLVKTCLEIVSSTLRSPRNGSQSFPHWSSAGLDVFFFFLCPRCSMLIKSSTGHW